ncbi:hypothetical protein HG535_0H04340 [Zygotorulaspora mrakii]|uniref:Major facilitator superfamily (MFS) profile domain-containing protein n=1 Tax=Zygotorulaspora mrakii TaxID=42260 RepID=A0A7H9B910_ZYGMR|nr:uncharacterized protein HG535_0H04340 [Zygotorulaspora mrakii]QLG75107.1 hypothetical protein HG535_0H04340 [Zygotorulaspora mrakii]
MLKFLLLVVTRNGFLGCSTDCEVSPQFFFRQFLFRFKQNTVLCCRTKDLRSSYIYRLPFIQDNIYFCKTQNLGTDIVLMGPYRGDRKGDTSIELENLLEQDDSLCPDSPDEVGYKGLVEDIQWKGNEIKLYPLNYQTVGIVRLQMAATLVMFLVFGLNDQTTGSLIPTLTERYQISKVVVSNIFITQVLGYMLASLMNEKIHVRWGMRGAMTLAVSLCVVFFGILSLRPSSFIVYVVCYLPLGFSIGILDSTGNVLMGNLEIHKNEWMGVTHGLYGAASMVTPPIVSHFVKYGNWSNFFYIPLVVSLVGLLLVLPAFRFETSAKYEYICNVQQKEDDDILQEDLGSGFMALLKTPGVFMYAMYLFVYLGAEISTGTWLFSYLLATKSDDRILMSYVTSSYWTGLTFGRFCLGFVTKRKFPNEFRASYAYGLLTFFFYTLLVLVCLINTNDKWYIALLFFVLFFCGVFIGPLFPNASVVALQVLPKKLHIGGVGLAVAIGGSGNALLPYLVGITLHLAGMQFFPILCWSMVAGFNLIWCLYPRFLPV